MSNYERPQPGLRAAHDAPPEHGVLDNVSKALAGLRFGSIEIVVHEGKVTQIERKEKLRL